MPPINANTLTSLEQQQKQQEAMDYFKAKLLQKRRRKHKVKNLDPGELSFVKIVDSL